MGVRIKSTSGLSDEAYVLDFSAAGFSHSTPGDGLDVQLSNGGSLPAVTISPVAHATWGVTLKDDAATPNTIYRVGNIGLNSSHFGTSILLYGSNGTGPNGETFNFGTDSAAATPYRDFFLSKVLSTGDVSDADGMYISAGAGDSMPAVIGFGLAQPGDSGRNVRVKIQGGSTTQGGLQILQSTTNTTVPPLSITDTGAKDRVWVDPASANNWRLRLAGDTTTSNVILSIQDLTTSSTVPFTVAANGSVTISNPGANTALFQIGNTAKNGSIRVISTGEMQLGNSTNTNLISLGNHTTSWAALGFFGAAAVAQPSAAGSATGYTAGATAAAFHSDDTYTGNVGSTAYTINGIVAALKNLGLIAS